MWKSYLVIPQLITEKPSLRRLISIIFIRSNLVELDSSPRLLVNNILLFQLFFKVNIIINFFKGFVEPMTNPDDP